MEKYSIFMTVGIYADNPDCEESKKIKSSIDKLIKENKNIMQIHGFFVDTEEKVGNFDLVFSFDEDEPEIVVKSIKEQLEKEYEGYTFYINIDRDYSLS